MLLVAFFYFKLEMKPNTFKSCKIRCHLVSRTAAMEKCVENLNSIVHLDNNIAVKEKLLLQYLAS